MNHITLVGRTTSNIELKYTQGGTAYAHFTLAIDRKKDKDGTKKTDFIPCTAWSKGAEILSKYVSKGHRLGVEGRLQSRQYEKDGKKITTYEVVVNDFEFLQPKGQGQTQEDISDEEIPF